MKATHGFYKTNRWCICRDAYLKKVSYLCEDCLEKGIVKGADEVHHIIHLNAVNMNDPKIAFNEQNLKALCKACHTAQHYKEKAKRYKVDEAGRVIPLI